MPSDHAQEGQEVTPLAKITPTPEVIIQQAIDKGMSGAELKDLLAFAREVRREHAEVAFNDAFAKFKSTCPAIPRLHESSQFTRVTRAGNTAKGRYAALEDIAQVIDPKLAECGLFYRWTETTVADGLMVVTCVVSHVAGHSISSVSPPMPVESKAGSSAQQKYGSACSYARRYSLVSALGLATVDPDDDGVGGEGNGDEPAGTAGIVTEQQYRALEDAISTLTELTGDQKHRDRMLKYLGVEKVSDCPAARYMEVANKLRQKIASAKAEKQADGT